MGDSALGRCVDTVLIHSVDTVLTQLGGVQIRDFEASTGRAHLEQSPGGSPPPEPPRTVKGLDACMVGVMLDAGAGRTCGTHSRHMACQEI